MTAAIAPGSVEGVGHVGAVAGHFRTGATDLVDQEGDGRLFVSRGGLMSIIPRGRLLLFVPSERHITASAKALSTPHNKAAPRTVK